MLALSSRQESTSRGNAPNMITAPDERQELISAGMILYPYSINCHHTGHPASKDDRDIDTVGVLYGPDGQQIATDDNSGAGMNFLITEYVEAGLYIVTVEGQTRTTTGMYTVVTNFVEGADIDVGTRPGTGTGTVAELEERITELEDDLDICRMPVETDARGATWRIPLAVDTEAALASSRAGCVRPKRLRSSLPLMTAKAPRRSSLMPRMVRAGPMYDDASLSDNDPNTGFGMTYNFNHLREGEYTIEAFADGDEDEPIGQPQTFNVVHLTTFAIDDRG